MVCSMVTTFYQNPRCRASTYFFRTSDLNWRIKKLLFDLYGCGIDVKFIHNYENSPCCNAFPESVDIITGAPWKYDAVGSEKEYIPVAWEFWRNDVVQHVLEPEVV